MKFKMTWLLPASAAAMIVAGCGGGPTDIPQLSAASSGTLSNCSTLLSSFSFPNTSIVSASTVNSGTLTNAGQAVGEHCLVTGKMNQRVSTVDGQTYAIGFEMRLPKDWSGRYLYQGNGGTDGAIAQADGGNSIGSGGLLKNGLQLGFAIISSDAGHTNAQNPLFGVDPQARLDYGYQAVGTLTPMAKALIKAAYGKGPDRSYIAGTSNGGRHAMVAASRYANEYDGYLANSPGFNLPKAAIAQLYGAQQWSTVATSTGTAPNFDLESAFVQSERALVSQVILSKCDALDGVTDGLVQDFQACRAAFDVARDIPTCSGERDFKTCLSSAQKTVLAKVYAGARNSKGDALYSRFPFDPGIKATGWADWKFRNSIRNGRDPVALAFIFSSPPASTVALPNTLTYALNFNMDTDAPTIFNTSGIYAESAMSFMTPPNPTNLDTLRNRGAKMLVIHGASDPVFSADDTANWYDKLDNYYGGSAAMAVRFFLVPGMLHSRGGPATDQYDGLTTLVNWVEKGQAPDRITATARGLGNAGGVNADIPSDWSATRTRPLCPYPTIARYKSGNVEVESSFACER
ncbi:MAG: hypothetical protein RL650_1144 [Pseudomonadota bacterium]|jgi:feruloyl esterase